MSKYNFSFPDIKQEELDKFDISQEVQQFYSEPDNLKRLLIEHTLYKKAYEPQTQKQNINDVVSKIDNIMSQKITQTLTLRQYAYNKYYNQKN